MPLQYQHIPIRFQGLDTKTDPVSLDAGKLVTMQNCVMDKTWRIQNRYGYTRKISSGTFSLGCLLAPVGNTMFYLRTNGKGMLLNKTTEEAYTVQDPPISYNVGPTTSSSQYSVGFTINTCSVAYTSSRVCYAYSYSKEANYGGGVSLNVGAIVFDLASGQVVSTLPSPSNFSGAKIRTSVASSLATNQLFVCYQDDDYEIKFYRMGVGQVATLSLSAMSPSVLNSWDFCCGNVTGSTTNYQIAFVYYNGTAAKYLVYNSATNAWSTEQTLGTAGTSAVAVNRCQSANEFVFAAAGDGVNNIYYDKITTSGVTITKDINTYFTTNLICDVTNRFIRKLAVSFLNLQGAWVFETHACGTAETDPIRTVLFKHNLGFPATIQVSLDSVELVTKPTINSDNASFSFGLRTDVDGISGYATQAACRVGLSTDYGNMRYKTESLAFFAAGSAIFPGDEYCQDVSATWTPVSGLSECTQYNHPSFEDGGILSGTSFAFGNPATSLIVSTIQTSTSASSSTLPTSAATFQNLCHNAWGNLSFVPKQSLTSYFQLWETVPYPRRPTLDSTATATGTGLTAGDYQYVVVLECVSADGRIIRSSPSAPLTVTISTNKKAKLIIWEPTIFGYMQSDGTPVRRAVIYRTESNGTIFYRLGEQYQNSTYDYSTGNWSALCEDELPDADIIGNPVLYTTGGILENSPAPLAYSISIARNRAWVCNTEQTNEVWFSQKLIPNEGMAFNDVLKITTPNIGGRCIYVAEMDDKIVIFKDYAIYVTFGDGPDATGSGEFAEPHLITQSLGCKYPRSVVLTDNGIMFMSHEGIWLLTRGLSLEYVGAGVSDSNALVITGAINLTDRHQVWFFSDNGTTLCWDEYHKLWSIFIGPTTWCPALTNDGIPAFLGYTNGYYYLESSSSFTDAGTAFAVKFKTGWMALSGIQGFERVRRVTWEGSASNNSTVTLYRDFSASSFETFTIPAATYSGAVYQPQVRPKIQKCEALQIEMEWSSLSAAVQVSALGLEAGAKAGTFKVKPANRIAST